MYYGSRTVDIIAGGHAAGAGAAAYL